MDPYLSATPFNDISDAESTSDPRAGSGRRFQDWRMQLQDTVRPGILRRLTQALQRKLFTPECTAATYAELQIYKRATNEHDYHTQINDLFHHLELFPEAPQKYPGSNKSFSNQYEIDQVPRMMPPQWGLNPSQNVVMPSTDQPSTSRQQQGQPLVQGLANRPRIVPGGPTGSFPGGMYSDTERRQQEMQLQSQNQMQYQRQSMMHQGHQMTQTQQNLLALGGSLMMSASPTAGMSNAPSAMGVQQMNNMTTLQQSESLGVFIQQQQQLQRKQRIQVDSCFPGMMPPQWGLNPSQNVVMPSTDQPSTSRQQQGQPLIQGLANRPRIVPGGPTGPFPVGMYSDTERRQQEMQLQSQNQMQYRQQSMMHQRHQMTQTQQNLLALGGSLMMSASPAAGMSNAPSAMGVQQMNNMTTLQKQQSEESLGDFTQQQQQLQRKQRIQVGSCSAPVDLTDDQPVDIYQKQEFFKKTHGMQLSEIARELLLVSIQVGLLPAESPFCKEMLKKITDAENKLDDLVTVLNFHVDALPINLKDKLHRFEEFMPVVVEQAKLVINQGQHFLRQQPQLQLQQGPSLTATGAPLSHSNNSRNSNSQANP